MSSRLKSTTFATRSEFLAAIDQIARTQTALRTVTARRDKAIQSVQEQYQGAIEEHEAEQQRLLAAADAYAQTHRDELFTGAEKTAETELATYGFRLHPPALKPLNRKWSAASILDAVKRAFGTRYVATEEKIQKELLKADLSEEQLATVGLRLEQTETFGVTPKVDGAATEQTA